MVEPPTPEWLQAILNRNTKIIADAQPVAAHYRLSARCPVDDSGMMSLPPYASPNPDAPPSDHLETFLRDHPFPDDAHNTNGLCIWLDAGFCTDGKLPDRIDGPLLRSMQQRVDKACAAFKEGLAIKNLYHHLYILPPEARGSSPACCAAILMATDAAEQSLLHAAENSVQDMLTQIQIHGPHPGPTP